MFESKTLESKIEESNVGHQMLKKMGTQQQREIFHFKTFFVIYLISVWDKFLVIYLISAFSCFNYLYGIFNLGFYLRTAYHLKVLIVYVKCCKKTCFVVNFVFSMFNAHPLCFAFFVISDLLET